jgi:predicted enzyme related to lactoylglutathione lyase
VGDVLILAGPTQVLDAFRAMQVTVIVDDLDAALQRARSQDGSVLRGPATQPTGRNATVSYSSGATIEMGTMIW